MDNSWSRQSLLHYCELPYATVKPELVYSAEREKCERGQLSSCFHLGRRKLWAAPRSKEQAHTKIMKDPLSMVLTLTFLI